MPSPNSANITTGPGLIYFAPIGTTEPTTRTGTWDAGWLPVGYTSEGHSFNHGLTIENIEVAELLEPVRRVTTARDDRFVFSMSEITLAHYKLALNGGTTTVDGTLGSIYEPPVAGQEIRHMLGWDSEDGLERLIIRRAISSGNVETARRKGTDYAKLPVEFALEAPTGGLAPWRQFFETARVAA
jgi:hypothetical protein